MSERKPSNQSWRDFTEQKILAAQEDGAFQNLPGLGQPIPGIDEPLDENWWVRRKLQAENAVLVPPLLEAQRDIARTRERALACTVETVVREMFRELAERVSAAILNPTPSPPIVVLPIDLESELASWRSARTAQTREPRTQ